jgi:hypothetical protein
MNTIYAVISRKRFESAVIALLFPMFLCIGFCAGELKNRYTKEEEYRSAEGFDSIQYTTAYVMSITAVPN